MDMLRVYSMDDMQGLPRTKWNIQQPEGMAWTPLWGVVHLQCLQLWEAEGSRPALPLHVVVGLAA